MVDNSNMPHPKCLGSQKNPGTEPKTCEKEPKLGFEYLPTSKTLHCVRTACALRAWHSPCTPLENLFVFVSHPVHKNQERHSAFTVSDVLGLAVGRGNRWWVYPEAR